jgi:hypothetical protein
MSPRRKDVGPRALNGLREEDNVMKRKATIGKSKALGRVCSFGVALMIVSVVVSPAFALDPMGPPATDLRKGEYKGGIDISFSSQDLDTSPGTWKRYVDAVLDDSGPANLGTLDNFEVYRAYATVAYSPAYSWEAFVRLGGATGELGDEFWSQGEEFDSGLELAVGAGLRATFFEELALKIGGLVQANYSEFDGKVDASGWAGPHFLEVKMLEAQAAIGATYLFSDRFSVYGGPFAHVIYGDIDYVYSVNDNFDFVTWRFNWDVEDDINYGAYFGARYKLKQDCSFNIEYQQTSNAYAVGASLMFRR